MAAESQGVAGESLAVDQRDLAITMGADHRVTLTRRHAYRTASNRVKTIKTPGGRYAAQYIKKSRKGAQCGDCKCALPGVRRIFSVLLILLIRLVRLST